jgi:hypothetical protein
VSFCHLESGIGGYAKTDPSPVRLVLSLLQKQDLSPKARPVPESPPSKKKAQKLTSPKKRDKNPTGPHKNRKAAHQPDAFLWNAVAEREKPDLSPKAPPPPKKKGSSLF